jgi:hypothetical protein
MNGVNGNERHNVSLVSKKLIRRFFARSPVNFRAFSRYRPYLIVGAWLVPDLIVSARRSTQF